MEAVPRKEFVIRKLKEDPERSAINVACLHKVRVGTRLCIHEPSHPALVGPSVLLNSTRWASAWDETKISHHKGVSYSGRMGRSVFAPVLSCRCFVDVLVDLLISCCWRAVVCVVCWASVQQVWSEAAGAAVDVDLGAFVGLELFAEQVDDTTDTTCTVPCFAPAASQPSHPCLSCPRNSLSISPALSLSLSLSPSMIPTQAPVVAEEEERWIEKLKQDEELTKLDGKRRVTKGIREAR